MTTMNAPQLRRVARRQERKRQATQKRREQAKAAAAAAEARAENLEHFQPDWKIRLAYTTHCKWGAATPYQRTIDPHGAKNARFDIILPVSRDIGAGHAGGLARPPGSCQCKRSSSSALGAPPLTTGREYRQFSSQAENALVLQPGFRLNALCSPLPMGAP